MQVMVKNNDNTWWGVGLREPHNTTQYFTTRCAGNGKNNDNTWWGVGLRETHNTTQYFTTRYAGNGKKQ